MIKLKKFTKNKKLKTIFMGSIVGILLIVGGISLYRSFAMYKEEKTFDVLNGTVPDFVYKESILNGAYPVLKSSTGAKLIPVTIDENDGTVRKADIKDEWYNYEDKKWANAVILVDGATEPKNDEEIPEENIESYFVWIPKYKYKIQTLETSDTGSEKAFEIQFGLEDTTDTNESCATPNKSGDNGKCQSDYWMTHPAFTAFTGSHGMWVGKFETGESGVKTSGATKREIYSFEDISKIVVKPNQYSWTNTNQSTMYQLAFNYQRDLDSHMMKNTEWGAVAYLTQSIYGRCTNSISCTEVTINSNSNYQTGYTNTSVAYPSSKDASTTGNITGVYDMAGGAWEYVMGVMKDANNSGYLFAQSGFNSSTFPFDNQENNKKYYDVYIYDTKNNTYNRRILGDATAETKFWNDDWAIFVFSDGPWVRRGGYKGMTSNAGVFSFYSHIGAATNLNSFRIALTP